MTDQSRSGNSAKDGSVTGGKRRGEVAQQWAKVMGSHKSEGRGMGGWGEGWKKVEGNTARKRGGMKKGQELKIKGGGCFTTNVTGHELGEKN